MTRRPARRPIKNDDDVEEAGSGLRETATGMLIGGVILSAGLLIRQSSWTFSVVDVGFWVSVLGFVGLRWVAATKKTTAHEKVPWAQFALGLTTACAAWLVAQALGGDPIE